MNWNLFLQLIPLAAFGIAFAFLSGIVFRIFPTSSFKRLLVSGFWIAAALTLPPRLVPDWPSLLHAVLYSTPGGAKIVAVIAVFGAYGAGVSWAHPKLARVSLCLSLLPALVVIAGILWRGHLVVPVLGTAWIFWLSAQLGRAVCRTQSPTCPLPIALAVGLAILMQTAFFLGALGMLVTPAIVALEAALTAIFWRPLTNLPKTASRLFRRQGTDKLWEGLAMGVLLGLGVVAGAMLVVPEIGADALGGRAAMSLRFLAQGSLDPFQDILFSFGTVGGEALQCWFVPFAGPRVARFLAVGIVFSLLFARPLNRPGALVWLLPGALSSLFLWQFAVGHVDIPQALFWLAAVWSAARSGRSPSQWAIAGFLAGAAAAVKLNGLGAALASLAILPFDRQRWANKVKSLACFFCGFGVGLGPWLARSFLITGNPVFPFAGPLFPRAIQNPPPLARFGIGLHWPEILRLPYLIFTSPERFVEAGGLNPFLFAVFVVSLWGLLRRSARKFTVASLATWAFWTITEQNLRYAVPAVCLTSLAASLTFLTSSKKGVSRHLLPALLMGTLVGTVSDYKAPVAWFLRAPTGLAFPYELISWQESERNFLARTVPSAELGETIKQAGTPWPQVCQVGFRDHLYVPGTQPVLWHSLQPLSSFSLALFSAANPLAALRAARSLSCDWIMLELGKNSEVATEKRVGVFSESFWNSFGVLEGALRRTVLLRRHDVPSKLQPWQWGPPQPLLLHGSQGERRFWSDSQPVSSGGFLRCTFSVSAPAEGFLDLAARGENNKLLMFFRQEFRLAPFEHFLLLQTLPPAAVVWSLSFSGVVAVDDLQCQVAHRGGAR